MVFYDDKLKEECGVVGIYAPNNSALSQMLYFCLTSLQHRGQESTGMAIQNGTNMTYYKRMGLVQEVFSDEILASFSGCIGIGHVRYSTTGRSDVSNAQPLVVSYKGGSIGLGHNGNLVNADFLREELESKGAIFQTSTDTEVIAHLIAKNYEKGYKNAVLKTLDIIQGAYAIALICEQSLIGVRDPHGIRPLVLGKIDDGYILASETVALDAIGAEFVRDIEAGEMVIINEKGIESIKYSDNTRVAHSSFEYVYFARPDSIIDGKSVYKTRKKAGELLAKNYPVEADIVIPVPDSGRSAAIGYSSYSKIPYEEGLIKNKYVGRTFIQPSQELREKALKLKLNALSEIISGKRLVLIDDSIVRGTTCKKIVKMLKDAGAIEVHLRVSSPPVKYPSFYGIDTPSAEELIASTKSVDEIAEILGVDSLAYLSVDQLVESIGFERDMLCLDCFTGEYPVEVPKYTNKYKYDNTQEAKQSGQ